MLPLDMTDNENTFIRWEIWRTRSNVNDPSITDFLRIENSTPTEDNLETSRTKDDTSNDEHITYL